MERIPLYQIYHSFYDQASSILASKETTSKKIDKLTILVELTANMLKNTPGSSPEPRRAVFDTKMVKYPSQQQTPLREPVNTPQSINSGNAEQALSPTPKMPTPGHPEVIEMNDLAQMRHAVSKKGRK